MDVLPVGGRKGSGNHAYNVSFPFPTNRGKQYFSMYSAWSMVCLHPVELLLRPRVVTKTAHLLPLARRGAKAVSVSVAWTWIGRLLQTIVQPAAMGNLGKCGTASEKWLLNCLCNNCWLVILCEHSFYICTQIVS